MIDPATLKVVDQFKVGRAPQHVVPAWDLRTLGVANNAERSAEGNLTPIDPRTGKPGSTITVDDPYSMYFTPDGKSAIVVARSRASGWIFAIPKPLHCNTPSGPQCGGINHADFSIDGRYAMFTCEFQWRCGQD